MKVSTFFAFGVALGMATGVYLLKDQVQRGEGELRRVRAEVQVELGRIDRLRTEWAVLNRPGRLADLAAAHLGLEPLDPTRLVAIDDVPREAELLLVGQTWSARLPSGAAVALRLKPRASSSIWSVAAQADGASR